MPPWVLGTGGLKRILVSHSDTDPLVSVLDDHARPLATLNIII